MFGRLKDWRRIATRYDRCPKVFLSAVALTAIVIFRIAGRIARTFRVLTCIKVSGAASCRLYEVETAGVRDADGRFV